MLRKVVFFESEIEPLFSHELGVMSKAECSF